MPQNNSTRLEALEAEVDRRKTTSQRQVEAALARDDESGDDRALDRALSTSERQAALVTGERS